MTKKRKDDNLRKMHPKALEAIATKLTGIEAEVELGKAIKADRSIHKTKTSGKNNLSLNRNEG